MNEWGVCIHITAEMPLATAVGSVEAETRSTCTKENRIKTEFGLRKALLLQGK